MLRPRALGAPPLSVTSARAPSVFSSTTNDGGMRLVRTMPAPSRARLPQSRTWSSKPAAQIVDVVDPVPDVGVRDEAQPRLELVESSVDGEGRAHPEADLLVDVLQERRIVEEQQMRRKDEGVLLVGLARRRKLDPRDVIVRLLDCGSHARTLHGRMGDARSNVVSPRAVATRLSAIT